MLASPIILYDYPQIAPESPGDLFDGTEIEAALLRGLADSPESRTLLEQIDRCAPGANAAAKRLIQASRDGPTPAYIEDAARSFAACLRGPEGREGVAAFLEKRAPSWAGQKS